MRGDNHWSRKTLSKVRRCPSRVPLRAQVLLLTGLLMAVSQLVLFPSFIKTVGIATWQRLGCIIGVPAIITIPSVKMLSWNHPSLFAVSVTANTLTNCSLGAVSRLIETVVSTLLAVQNIAACSTDCILDELSSPACAGDAARRLRHTGYKCPSRFLEKL